MTNEPKRGGRKSTGTILKTKTGVWQGVITLADGSRKRLPAFPAGTSEMMAREKTAAKQAQAIANGATKPKSKSKASASPSPGGAAWWEAYLAHREGKGLSPVLDLYRSHIEPVLGDKHPKDWTPADCERLRDALDEKIRVGFWQRDERRYSFGWKRAWNVWSLFTTACKAAARSKNRELRVRDDNPCADIDPPDRGEHKQKQWLYPVEFSQVVACEAVPMRWRQLYAVLTYTYLRAGELTVLDWRDVDLEAGTIHVTKAWDHKNARLGTPKSSAGVRYVPIERELMPLLKALHEASGGQGRVFPSMPPMEDWAAKLRQHLRRAGVERAALFEDSATVKNITLHDLRSTGITWRCLRKDYGPEIQQAAGHEKYDTTDGYVRTARVFDGRIGSPFPALPESLMGASRSPNRSPKAQVRETIVTPAGIEPALPA